MTRTFNGRVHCPKCGTWHSAETAFERWMRNDSRLDSRSAGIVRFDCDILLHQYKTYIDGKGSRLVQNMMFVEVKTHSAVITESQRDTLGLLDKILRNRRVNRHQYPRKQADAPAVTRAWSHVNGRDVALACWGGHLLTFSENDPTDSRLIKWDSSLIDAERLIELLTFVRDPDNPSRKIDKRRRYKSAVEFAYMPLIDGGKDNGE